MDGQYDILVAVAVEVGDVNASVIERYRIAGQEPPTSSHGTKRLQVPSPRRCWVDR